VLVGEGLSRLVPQIWIKRAAGALFIVLGIVFVLGKE
jgi:putative Ca2+/H+ antiporter (TMEM165/GDT1 family)